MEKRLFSSVVFLLFLFGCLCGCDNKSSPSPTQSVPTESEAATATPAPTQTPVTYLTPTAGDYDASAIKTDVIERLEDMFAGGTKIWYECSEDYDAPDKDLTQKSFDLDEDKLKRYENLFNCTWERADSADADETGAAVIIGDDDKHCFRFFLGSDIVAYIDGEETEYYRAYIEIEEDYFPDYPRAPLPKVIMQDFSGYERSASRYIPLKDGNFENKEEIAYAFMEQYADYLKALTPENWYSLTDYQILELRIKEQEEDKFVFWIKTAVKPTIFEGSPWIAGNGEVGEGEWAGYFVNKTNLYRLDLIDGYWICVNAGTGDIWLKDPVTYPTPTPALTPTPTPTPTPTVSANVGADVTVLEHDGISIAIPNEHYELLLFNPENNFYHTNGALIEVYYKPTYEQEHAMGWLYSIVRYSRAQYEQYLSKGDSSGQSFFAKDDTYYYGYFRPTDIQFDKIDMDIYNDLKYNLSEFVMQDMITRNDLTPYSDDDFWSKTYTYESDHIYLTYYPYYAYQDTAAQQNFSWQDVAYTLVLSQPAAQGDTGIWCVERMYDDPKYGFIYVYFPDADGLSSAEYYAKLQGDCDSGLGPDLLDPTQVALDYVKLVFGHSSATVDSFELTDALPEGNFRH